MRVAYLFSRFPVLSQTFCVTEMLALERLGCEIVVGALYPPETLLRHAAVSQLKGQVLYNPPRPALARLREAERRRGNWPEALLSEHVVAYGSPVNPNLRAENAAWFAREFQRRGVEHVHVHFANRATITALYLKRLSGIPFSFTAHAQDFLVDFYWRGLLGELVAEAEFVIAVSDWSRDLLAKEFPAQAAKIHRIHNGIDLSLFTPGPPPLADASKPARLLSIGRLIPFKGFEVLIDACERLSEKGVSFLCEIVGDGPLEKALRERISEAGLGDCVTLTGPLPQQEVLEHLRRCDLFTLASITDSKGACDVLPTVITEAMACGRPVVSTTTAGIPEQVIDGVTGRLVPPGDPSALASAIEQILLDPALAARMGAAGLARSGECFSSISAARQLLNRFELSGAGSRRAAESSTPQEIVLMDQWPAPGRDPEFHLSLAGRIEEGDASLICLKELPPQKPPRRSFLDRIMRRWPVIIPPPPPATIFPPPQSVSEALWLDRGRKNDEILAMEKDLPEGYNSADLYAAARALLALRQSVDRFNTAPLKPVGPISELIAWLREKTTGALAARWSTFR